ncbi:beta-N-acetylhexosaminidase [Bacillus salipaludis]|uniref:beta-N-acetylhexosaminidase n=1 Tax=Bacillus salipaludis TaxID=2547811 RepID=UPI003D1B3256
MTRVRRRKKNKIGFILLFLLALLIVAGVAFQLGRNSQESVASVGREATKESVESTTSSKKDANTKGKQQIPQKKQSIDEKVNQLIKQMTLQEKVGQMLMVGFYGTEEDDKIKNMILSQKVGGVILFDRNMQTPQQVAGLTNQLKRETEKNKRPIPLMIGLDQEGGPVLRMRDAVSPIPSEQKLGQIASPQEVFNISRLNGEELAAMGIQLDFAPVLDLSDQDERSFGSNPNKGFNLGLQSIKGLNSAKVTATIKHFPGNGRVVVDPHLDTSIVKADKNTLENVDMVPFKQMIQRQKENQFFVMVTHVKYPAFDTKMPASISKTIIQGLLRDQLGYQGIVVTDDLDMGAVSKYYSYEQLGYMAVNAGADLLLVCHDYNHQLQLYNGIIQSVQTGKLSEDRINQSVKRILTYKFKHMSNHPVSEANAGKVVRSKKHLDMISNIYK